MKVIVQASVDAALRTLVEDDRRKVLSWFDHLRNWENDEHVREMAKAIGIHNYHVINTTDDIRIFFTLDEVNREIDILDLARPSRFPVASAAG